MNPTIKVSTTRRNFLKTSSAISTGLLFGFWLPLKGRRQALADTVNKISSNKSRRLSAFIHILPDNNITIILHKSEMGQGVLTTLPAIIAEELEADWRNIKVEQAPVHPDFNHTVWGAYQGTGASSSVSSSWDQLRLAGATVREMLIAAAADSWDTSPHNCIAENSYVIDLVSRKYLTFGAVSNKAAQIIIPSNVALKEAKDFKLIGKSISRLDTVSKVRATAVYGIDVQVPEMLSVVIARPPISGGKLNRIDDRVAKQVAGVQSIISTSVGVAVIANDFWTAKTARDLLEVTWDESEKSALSSAVLEAKYAALAEGPGLVVKETGDASEILATTTQKIEAIYELPYLAHAPMEPLNCVADVRETSCDIWTGTQMQTTDQQAVCDLTGLTPRQVKIHTTLLGGSFGRRANPHADFVKEAVQISKTIRRPVKVFWTREDDIRGGYYRPMHYSKIAAAIDETGQPVAWIHRLVGESIGTGTQFESLLVKHGIDHLSVEGAEHPYSIEHQLINYHPVDNGIPVLWWRSVGHSYTAFVVESFIDELAIAKECDPLDLRLKLLEDKPAHRKVLQLVADKARWGTPLSEGICQGIALHKSFGSIVGQVADVSVTNDGWIKVHRIVCAVDCGFAVNPNIIRAQIESGIVYGLSALLYGEITLKSGRVQESNFHDYQVLRMDEMPVVEVHIIDSKRKPSGVGEISTPPVAPAVCNAIFAATGQRIRKLPVRRRMLKRT